MTTYFFRTGCKMSESDSDSHDSVVSLVVIEFLYKMFLERHLFLSLCCVTPVTVYCYILFCYSLTDLTDRHVTCWFIGDSCGQLEYVKSAVLTTATHFIVDTGTIIVIAYDYLRELVVYVYSLELSNIIYSENISDVEQDFLAILNRPLVTFMYNNHPTLKG